MLSLLSNDVIIRNPAKLACCGVMTLDRDGGSAVCVVFPIHTNHLLSVVMFPFVSLSLSLSSSQDNFAFSEEYETAHGVYEAIQDVMNNHVVTHENDRTWRNAVVTNKPSLLALR